MLFTTGNNSKNTKGRVNPLPHILTHLRYIAVENIVKKSRNGLLQAISPFLTMLFSL